MKTKKLLTILLVTILCLSVTSFGAEGIQKIEAYLSNDLNFSVDGQQWSPKDVDGSSLTPILYNNRTYVPVRSLLQDKGVTVGYNDRTKTVSLDYSTIKLLDKSTPVLIKLTPSTGSAGKVSFSDLSFTKNSNFQSSNISYSQEYTFDLKDSTTIFVDGKQVEGKLEDIIKSAKSWSAESLMLQVDEATGAVTSAKITSDPMGTETGDVQGLKVSVTIEISGPPLKIKITIRF